MDVERCLKNSFHLLKKHPESMAPFFLLYALPWLLFFSLLLFTGSIDLTVDTIQAVKAIEGKLEGDQVVNHFVEQGITKERFIELFTFENGLWVLIIALVWILASWYVLTLAIVMARMVASRLTIEWHILFRETHKFLFPFLSYLTAYTFFLSLPTLFGFTISSLLFVIGLSFSSTALKLFVMFLALAMILAALIGTILVVLALTFSFPIAILRGGRITTALKQGYQLGMKNKADALVIVFMIIVFSMMGNWASTLLYQPIVGLVFKASFISILAFVFLSLAILIKAGVMAFTLVFYLLAYLEVEHGT